MISFSGGYRGKYRYLRNNFSKGILSVCFCNFKNDFAYLMQNKSLCLLAFYYYILYKG